MGRGLVTLGAILVLSTVSLWIADAAGWIAASSDDRLSSLTLRAGLLLVAGGLVMRLLNPVRTKLIAGRCVSCGRPVLRGHLYCQDHLRDSVNAWRDQSHDGLIKRPKGRA